MPAAVPGPPCCPWARYARPPIAASAGTGRRRPSDRVSIVVDVGQPGRLHRGRPRTCALVAAVANRAAARRVADGIAGGVRLTGEDRGARADVRTDLVAAGARRIAGPVDRVARNVRRWRG